jgi:hypothetical protein
MVRFVNTVIIAIGDWTFHERGCQEKHFPADRPRG